MHATFPLLQRTTFPALSRRRLDTLQVNLGYKCNQSCLHCHVNAGPSRKEMMERETIDLVLRFLRASGVETLDVTGGAPELNEHFRHLVSEARAVGIRVIDRCNLTVLEQPGQEDTAEFLAGQGVEIVASLPCYLEDNVNRQRGDGVFQSSMRMLRRLNALGYAQPDSGLALNLVYNPQGPSLPPGQAKLEQDYRKFLGEQHTVQFNHLFTLANMPIQRFGSMLVSQGRFDGYLNVLRNSFREDNLAQLMCLNTLSIDWQGFVYDCDFNQMLSMPLGAMSKPRVHIDDLTLETLNGAAIATAAHCYGCTAGQGSSCGGAL